MQDASHIQTQKGYAALIGLLVAILIIALLAYGASFFSRKDSTSQPVGASELIRTKQGAEKDINAINDITKQRGTEME